jgi:succinoglycan biosynthesis protein ExoM
VLFRRTAPAFAGLRFREELGRSGGEDSVFFAEAYAAGARLACAPAAIVTEPVTPARATVRWLLQRRFRAGQTHTLLATGRLDLFIKALAKMLFCYLRGLLTLISVLIPFGKNTEKKVTSLRWLLRGTLHLGVVCRILGKSKIEPYGQPHG